MNGSINRRDFLKSLGIGAATLSVSFCRTGFMGSRPPNIVVIFADDLGYGDVGCYGARGYSTPNLDHMAGEGMRFTSFYVSQAVCSASRVSLLTGCYNTRVSIHGALDPFSNIGIHDNEETIAEVLKKKGYATAVFGKWHLGHHRQFLPLQHGFDEYLGLPYSNDMWPIGFDGKPASPDLNKAAYPFPPLIDGNEKIKEIKTLEDQNMLTTWYTERAVQFIEKNRNRPFFLYVPHSMPHVPLGVSEKFRGKSELGMYGDVIMEIDWSVGEILSALSKHKLETNTLVIFTSDNGPWLNYGNHAGSVGPLREGKGTSWEGGVRVPCIMRWPGFIPEGRACDRMASTIDLLPTFAAIAGAPLPEKTIDGINILPLLQGNTDAEPRTHLFYYYGRQLQCVREGKWKLHVPHSYRSYEGVEPGQDGFAGPYAQGQTGYELYNLEDDIGERNDVFTKHPEVAKRLEALVEAAREELGDEERIGKGARPSGRIGEEGEDG